MVEKTHIFVRLRKAQKKGSAPRREKGIQKLKVRQWGLQLQSEGNRKRVRGRKKTEGEETYHLKIREKPTGRIRGGVGRITKRGKEVGQ